VFLSSKIFDRVSPPFLDKLSFRIDTTEDCVYRVMVKQRIDDCMTNHACKRETDVIERAEKSAMYRTEGFVVVTIVLLNSIDIVCIV
jgi:hypothetical protein